MIEQLRHHPLRWLGVAGLAAAAAAANALLGYGAAVGERTLLLVVLVGMLPVALIAFGALVESQRALLVWVALASNFVGFAFIADPLSIPGDTKVFFPDVILLLAFGAWLAARLSGHPARNPVLLSPVFGWPLLLLGVTILGGVIVGYERYGASVVGQPLRIVLYAGIALALTDVDVASAWRAITIVFYGGAVVQSAWAVFYLATGSSQSKSDLLSTGGVRVLALSTAMYLTGSLICALLNLELQRQSGRQFLHLCIAGLALFGIVVSFGRTTYAAVVLIVPLLLISRRYLRRTVLVLIPLLVPALAVVAILLPAVAPNTFPTLKARLSGTSTNDNAVEWRLRAKNATLEGVVDEEWLTGVGFGRSNRLTTLDGRVETIAGDPHNSYVWILAGGGVLALGSLLWLCATYVLDAVRRLRRANPLGQALVTWSLATWFAFMINAATGPILSEPRLLMTIWILIALPSLVVAGTRRGAPS